MMINCLGDHNDLYHIISYKRITYKIYITRACFHLRVALFYTLPGMFLKQGTFGFTGEIIVMGIQD